MFHLLLQAIEHLATSNIGFILATWTSEDTRKWNELKNYTYATILAIRMFTYPGSFRNSYPQFLSMWLYFMFIYNFNINMKICMCIFHLGSHMADSVEECRGFDSHWLRWFLFQEKGNSHCYSQFS